MRIEHVAIWTPDLDRLRAFYERYFGAEAGPLYVNPAKQFSSYFLSFGGAARLEIMHSPRVAARPEAAGEWSGYAHLAIGVGSERGVDELAARLAADGVPLLDGPRRTGDGYYEAVVLDPDGNRVEITV